MTPKAKFFDWIEDYCLNQLNENEKKQFETELKRNRELREEVKLLKEIQLAITEKEISNIKEELNVIANSKEVKDKGSFDLLDDFTDIHEITETIPPEDLINYYDSLPKVHVYHHELSANENIHQFYKEQNKASNKVEEQEMHGFAFDDLEGMEEAIMEKDILNLRNTISQVSKSEKSKFSKEEIDKYLNGELKGSEFKKYEAEIDHNIEDYIDDELQGELREEFLAELNENTDLKPEVNMRSDVNQAIGGKDILLLRDKLKSARESAENTEIKSIVPNNTVKLLAAWKRVAVVIILLLGIAGLYNIGFNSTDKMYHSYYESPSWSPERSSAHNNHNYIKEANIYYQQGDYERALPIYDLGLKNVNEKEKFVFHFYKGASLQNMQLFEEAIPEYNRVIEQGDNYFIEEAEWYKSLCYLELGDRKMARQNLEAVVEKNGYYKKDAKSILRYLKFSIK